MKIRAIILSALILCGISAVIMYSRAAQPQQKSSVITQAINCLLYTSDAADEL